MKSRVKFTHASPGLKNTTAHEGNPRTFVLNQKKQHVVVFLKCFSFYIVHSHPTFVRSCFCPCFPPVWLTATLTSPAHCLLSPTWTHLPPYTCFTFSFSTLQQSLTSLFPAQFDLFCVRSDFCVLILSQDLFHSLTCLFVTPELQEPLSFVTYFLILQ